MVPWPHLGQSLTDALIARMRSPRFRNSDKRDVQGGDVDFCLHPTVEAVALDSEAEPCGDKCRLLAGSLLLRCRGYRGWLNTLPLEGARRLVEGASRVPRPLYELSWVKTRNPLTLRVDRVHPS